MEHHELMSCLRRCLELNDTLRGGIERGESESLQRLLDERGRLLEQFVAHAPPPEALHDDLKDALRELRVQDEAMVEALEQGKQRVLGALQSMARTNVAPYGDESADAEILDQRV